MYVCVSARRLEHIHVRETVDGKCSLGQVGTCVSSIVVYVDRQTGVNVCELVGGRVLYERQHAFGRAPGQGFYDKVSATLPIGLHSTRARGRR